MAREAEKRLSDADLAERINDRDEDAFNELYERYASKLLGFVLRRTNGIMWPWRLLQFTKSTLLVLATL